MEYRHRQRSGGTPVVLHHKSKATPFTKLSSPVSTLPPLPPLSGGGFEWTLVARSVEAADQEVAATIAVHGLGDELSDNSLRSPIQPRQSLFSAGQLHPTNMDNLFRSYAATPRSSHRRGDKGTPRLRHQGMAATAPSHTKWHDTSPRSAMLEFIDDKVEVLEELARHRLDVTRQASRTQRQQAHDRTWQRRYQLAQQQAKDVAEATGQEDTEWGAGAIQDDTIVGASEASPTSGQLQEEVFSNAEEDLAVVEGAGVQSMSLPALDNGNEWADTHEELEAKCPPGLGRVKPKMKRAVRMAMLQNLASNKQQQTRSQKLLSLRATEFESRSAAEQQALRKAFEDVNAGDPRSLNPYELQKALWRFGLRGTCEAEKTDMMNICNEVVALGNVNFFAFCFEAVARVRQRFLELRREPLFERFRMYDVNEAGQLSFEDCTRIFEQLCQWSLDSISLQEMKQKFDRKIREVGDKNTGKVSFKNFEMVNARMQEEVQRFLLGVETEIQNEEDLSLEVMYLHREGLVRVHHSFKQAASNVEGLLNDEVWPALIKNGFCPSESGSKELIANVFEHRAVGECLRFTDFLRMIRLLREVHMNNRHAELEQMFNRMDKTQCGLLEQRKVSLLLGNLGLAPHSREEQVEIRRLLVEASPNGNGEITFQSFELLVLQVRELLQTIAAEADRCTETCPFMNNQNCFKSS